MTTEATKEELDVSKLDFVKLKIPRLIPIELIDSVKGKTFSTDQFYKYQESQIENPYNFLYALVDEPKKIHGFIWAESNLLDGTLFVNTFSIGKEYWGKGKGIQKAIEFIRTLKDRIKSPKVFWMTTNEKFFIKHGFKRSKITLLEYAE